MGADVWSCLRVFTYFLLVPTDLLRSLPDGFSTSQNRVVRLPFLDVHARLHHYTCLRPHSANVGTHTDLYDTRDHQRGSYHFKSAIKMSLMCRNDKHDDSASPVSGSVPQILLKTPENVSIHHNVVVCTLPAFLHPL